MLSKERAEKVSRREETAWVWEGVIGKGIKWKERGMKERIIFYVISSEMYLI